MLHSKRQKGLRGHEQTTDPFPPLQPQAAVWEPQSSRRSRCRRRNLHYYLERRPLEKSINKTSLSTGRTPQDLVNLLTICKDSRALCVAVLQKASFTLRTQRHGVDYLELLKGEARATPKLY
jgi:hypothetical protein